MQPVSSVAAFIARYVGGAAPDPVAQEMLAGLDGEAQLAVAAQRVPAAERHAWLRQRSGHTWSAARLAHVEQRAFVELRRALQRRGLWST